MDTKIDINKELNIFVYKLPEKTALGTCLNFGVNKSNYNIIAKFDDDDYYGPYYLDEANKAFLREGCYVLGKQKTYYYLEQYKKLILKRVATENAYSQNLMGSTICFKRKVFDNIKFKDISIREDYNFNSECLKYGYMLYSTSSYNHLVFKHADINKHTFKSNINTLINKCIEIKSNIEFEEVKWNNDAIIIKNVLEEDIRKLKIYENGEIYLQSLSSMIPPVILEPKEKENILDMAAAPGGKTTQISAISSGKSYITACEKNKIRCDRLKYNLQKQGVGNVNVMQEDARKLSDFFSFDKILLDAPCSGSGTESVFNPKFTEELIQRSAKTQEELLAKALKILKKDGEIVYSTCSILKEENEKVLNKVLKEFNAKIVPIEKIEGIEYLPVEIEGTLCILPTELYEGFFVAKIRK